MRYQRHWVRGWLIAAAVLGVAVAGSLFVAEEVHEGRIEDRMQQLAPVIDEHARAADLPADFVAAVVRAESGGDPEAVSPVGAKGLMQVMPDAHTDARRIGRLPDGDLFDPAYNLRVGTTYLRHLFDRFDGDLRLTLAAYHMGPTRVASLRRKHPDLSSEQLVEQHAGSKTRAYVRQVLQRLGT